MILKSAAFRLDDIYRYTLNEWGKDQADSYILGLFEQFEGIANETVMSRPISAEFGVDGYFSQYKKHVVYWKRLPSGQVGIVTILHERMHAIVKLREDFRFK